MSHCKRTCRMYKHEIQVFHIWYVWHSLFHIVIYYFTHILYSVLHFLHLSSIFFFILLYFILHIFYIVSFIFCMYPTVYSVYAEIHLALFFCIIFYIFLRTQIVLHIMYTGIVLHILHCFSHIVTGI